MNTQDAKRYVDWGREHPMMVAISLGGPGLAMIVLDIFRMVGIALLVVGGAIYVFTKDGGKETATDGGEPVEDAEEDDPEAESEDEAEEDAEEDEDDDSGGLLSGIDGGAIEADLNADDEDDPLAGL